MHLLETLYDGGPESMLFLVMIGCKKRIIYDLIITIIHQLIDPAGQVIAYVS
jgi:hypothetical protein